MFPVISDIRFHCTRLLEHLPMLFNCGFRRAHTGFQKRPLNASMATDPQIPDQGNSPGHRYLWMDWGRGDLSTRSSRGHVEPEAPPRPLASLRRAHGALARKVLPPFPSRPPPSSSSSSHVFVLIILPPPSSSQTRSQREALPKTPRRSKRPKTAQPEF